VRDEWDEWELDTPLSVVPTICKDLATMLAEGKARGATLPLVEKMLAVYHAAACEGWGKRDDASLPANWPSRLAAAGENR
jgi:3-hydroxyisobutyrate dehydrogenase-like beta-hydroxyacid dehydrogenase